MRSKNVWQIYQILARSHDSSCVGNHRSTAFRLNLNHMIWSRFGWDMHPATLIEQFYKSLYLPVLSSQAACALPLSHLTSSYMPSPYALLPNPCYTLRRHSMSLIMPLCLTWLTTIITMRSKTHQSAYLWPTPTFPLCLDLHHHPPLNSAGFPKPLLMPQTGTSISGGYDFDYDYDHNYPLPIYRKPPLQLSHFCMHTHHMLYAVYACPHPALPLSSTYMLLYNYHIWHSV